MLINMKLRLEWRWQSREEDDPKMTPLKLTIRLNSPKVTINSRGKRTRRKEERKQTQRQGWRIRPLRS